MKKLVSAFVGLSLMATPMVSASASVRPASAIPATATSSAFVQDMDDDDNSELFVLAAMAGLLVLFALFVINEDDDEGVLVPPAISGG